MVGWGHQICIPQTGTCWLRRKAWSSSPKSSHGSTVLRVHTPIICSAEGLWSVVNPGKDPKDDFKKNKWSTLPPLVFQLQERRKRREPGAGATWGVRTSDGRAAFQSQAGVPYCGSHLMAHAHLPSFQWYKVTLSQHFTHARHYSNSFTCTDSFNLCKYIFLLFLFYRCGNRGTGDTQLFPTASG